MDTFEAYVHYLERRGVGENDLVQVSTYIPGDENVVNLSMSFGKLKEIVSHAGGGW